jgi:hypothetical protein
MTSWLRENDVLRQYLSHPEQPGRVCGVSSHKGWKFAWPQHASLYRKRKRASTGSLVDKQQMKEEIKQELKAEMKKDMLDMMARGY